MVRFLLYTIRLSCLCPPGCQEEELPNMVRVSLMASSKLEDILITTSNLCSGPDKVKSLNNAL